MFPEHLDKSKSKVYCFDMTMADCKVMLFKRSLLNMDLSKSAVWGCTNNAITVLNAGTTRVRPSRGPKKKRATIGQDVQN